MSTTDLRKRVLLSLVFLTLSMHGVADDTEDPESVALNILDTQSIPWDERFRLGSKETSKGKLLYSNNEGTALFYVHFSSGWTAQNTEWHYPNFAEWGYV